MPLARRLASASTEPEWRSAVSRAYYAAFHVARQLLEDLGFRVPYADRAHAYLWLRLHNCGDPQVRLAGGELNGLRGSRNLADYDLRHPFRARIASHRVRAADRIIRLLDAARQEPTRTQITDAMKAYERDVLKDITWHP
jgi:hypothetical protein